MPRLFTAIPLPDDVRRELAALRLPLPGAKWVEAEDYHLTLRFAGDIGNPQAREFADNLAHITADAFQIRLAGLGAFGGDDPSVVFAAVEACEPLEALARANDKAAKNAGIAAQKRPFRAHVTLARLKRSNAQAVAEYLSRMGGYRSEPIGVTEFVLMSSKPGTGGGPYGIVESYDLNGPHLYGAVDAEW